jgi:hypothetical protein
LDTIEPVCFYDGGGIIAANDLELYYALADKHNVDLIGKVILCCRQKLKWLFESKDHLFSTRVYFKLKNYDVSVHRDN